MKCLSSLPREERSGEKVQQGTFTTERANGWHMLASRAGQASDVRDRSGLD